MMTFAQVVKTSVNVTTNSPSQDYTHPDEHTPPTYDMTPGLRPSTKIIIITTTTTTTTTIIITIIIIIIIIIIGDRAFAPVSPRSWVQIPLKTEFLTVA